MKQGSRLVLAFEDCDDPTLGYRVATRADKTDALNFDRSYRHLPMLVHCVHGVGRSAAVALMAHADQLGHGREEQAMAALLAQRQQATPNLIAVELADDLLGAGGPLMSALLASEASDPAKQAARRNRLAFARANPSLFAKA